MAQIFQIRPQQFALPAPPVINNLYPFTTATFTNGGDVPLTGPTLNQARDGLTGPEVNDWKFDTDFLDVANELILWTVPITGYYEFDLRGGRGGGPTTAAEARGGRAQGQVYFQAGLKLRLQCGQRGAHNSLIRTYGGGGAGGARSSTSFLTFSGSSGGGGTDIRISDDLQDRILVAAGGGGSAHGPSGRHTRNGGGGGGSGYYGGGGGRGGLWSPSTSTGGGGGTQTEGGDGPNTGNGQSGSLGNGGNGGDADTGSGSGSSFTAIPGGFGGGLEGQDGAFTTGRVYMGGGGSSYFGGIVDYPVVNGSTTQDFHSGNGQVIVTYLGT